MNLGTEDKPLEGEGRAFCGVLERDVRNVGRQHSCRLILECSIDVLRRFASKAEPKHKLQTNTEIHRGPTSG